MRTSFVRAPVGACLLLLLGLPLSAGATLITDDFNDNALDPVLWSPGTVGDGTLAEINQRLEVAATDGYGVARLRGLVTGNFDLQFSYALLTDMDSMDPTDEAAVGVLFFGFESFLIRGIGCFESQVAEAIAEDCYGVTLGEQAGSFRLTRAGSLYTIYHWQGAAWAPLASGMSVQTGPVDFYLAGGTDTGEPLGVALDNFWLQSDGFVSEVPEPASFALVGVALGLTFIIRKRRQA